MSSEAYVENYLGNAFIEEPAIQRVTRMRNAAQRQFRETVTQLRALQAERKASDEPLPEFPPVREYDDTPKYIPYVDVAVAESIISAKIGFVPSSEVEHPETRPAVRADADQWNQATCTPDRTARSTMGVILLRFNLHWASVG